MCKCSGGNYLKWEHVLLQEEVGTGDDGALYAILRATRRTRQLSYALSESIVLRERLEESLSGGGRFRSRTLLLAVLWGE